MKTTKYTNWSRFIFDGFYESALYDSDKIHWANECDESGIEWDIEDYPRFEKEVCEEAVNILNKYTKGDIISKIEFLSLDSPREYNFRTDRLVCNVEYDEQKLMHFLQREKEDFDVYLRANWSSYDGFISFVANSYDEFMEKESFKVEVALEYIILRQLCGKEWDPECFRSIRTEYHEDIWEAADEIFHNSLVPVEK